MGRGGGGEQVGGEVAGGRADHGAPYAQSPPPLPAIHLTQSKHACRLTSSTAAPTASNELSGTRVPYQGIIPRFSCSPIQRPHDFLPSLPSRQIQVLCGHQR
ncbi:MAG: hypothetical protein FRX48_05949 [Lasallia pustulata]|uniref:Uncharacterized protein n=1 Tax=Lasallia pustulata TaxID=136370 RepID=A0A5M8PLW8_9LECA|nr:MAG: hypothetical protein FRX48_05949 [Lasallia pustulata]